MTIAELKTLIAELPDDMPVVIVDPDTWAGMVYANAVRKADTAKAVQTSRDTFEALRLSMHGANAQTINVFAIEYSIDDDYEY